MNYKRVILYAAMYAAIGACIGAGLAIYTQKVEDGGIVPDILTQRATVLKKEIAKNQAVSED